MVSLRRTRSREVRDISEDEPVIKRSRLRTRTVKPTQKEEKKPIPSPKSKNKNKKKRQTPPKKPKKTAKASIPIAEFIIDPSTMNFYKDSDFPHLQSHESLNFQDFHGHLDQFIEPTVCTSAPSQLATILSFFRTFQSVMYIDSFTCDDLIYAIDHSRDSELFELLFLQLLTLYQNKQQPATTTRYCEYVRTIVRRNIDWFEGDDGFVDDWVTKDHTFLVEADALTKANVLVNMCNWTSSESEECRDRAAVLIEKEQLDASMNGIGLRNGCLGHDRFGRFYYFFDGFLKQTSSIVFRTVLHEREELEIVTMEYIELTRLLVFLRNNSNGHLVSMLEDVLIPNQDRKRRQQLVKEEMLARSINYRKERPKRGATLSVKYNTDGFSSESEQEDDEGEDEEDDQEQDEKEEDRETQSADVHNETVLSETDINESTLISSEEADPLPTSELDDIPELHNEPIPNIMV